MGWGVVIVGEVFGKIDNEKNVYVCKLEQMVYFKETGAKKV